MTSTSLNRPLSAYVVVQASLVLIVLAASRPVHGFLQTAIGLEMAPLAVSLLLVALTQLPVAVMFARSEMRNLTSGEGWLLGGTFVGFTMLAESGLQALVAKIWPMVAREHGLGPDAAQDALVFGICATLLGFLCASFLVSSLFRLSVRKNLRGEHARTPKRLTRPRLVNRARLLRRAVCVLSAGLAGVGIAWALAFGWTVAHTHAMVVLTVGIIYTTLPRSGANGAVQWRAVWRDLLPAVLSGVMTFSITGAGMRVLLSGGRLTDLLAPLFGAADPAMTAAATAQVSGALLILLCANVVVIWTFVALVAPLLQTKRTPRPAALPVKQPVPREFADHPGLAGSTLPREEAIDLIRAAREMLLERQPQIPNRTMRPVA